MAHRNHIMIIPGDPFIVPQCDLPKFAGLTDELKSEVIKLLRNFSVAYKLARPLEHIKGLALKNQHLRGWAYKSLERKYYAVLRSGDWQELVNGAKAKGNGRSNFITASVQEVWKTYMMQSVRSYKTAYQRMVDAYLRGENIGDISWKDVWRTDSNYRLNTMPNRPPLGMKLPEGWSYGNFMRYQPTTIERLGARQGRQAARRVSRHVLTTRKGMRPGQQYMFDDLLHDNKVVFGDQFLRVWELAALDVASGHKITFAFKPNKFNDEKTAKENIREREMRFILAHVLCNIGYDPEGCELHVENGTSAIRKDLAALLDKLSEGVITVCRSGIDKKTASIMQWGHKRGGNPNAKAHLESLHNLVHNRLDWLPAQTGNNARINSPEDSVALQQYTDALISAGRAIPQELADELRFPVPTYKAFGLICFEVYDEISHRRNHNLEGWQDHVTMQWRLSQTDIWHRQDEWDLLTAEMQAVYRPLLNEGLVRRVKMSPVEVWDKGKDNLIRLPDYAAAMICGRDIGINRVLPASGEIVFQNKDIEDEPMSFRTLSCVNPNGEEAGLIEGLSYIWIINPFKPDCVYVMHPDGAYVGKCERIVRAYRMDAEAVGKAIGRATADLNAQLEPLKRRGAAIARTNLANIRHNAEIARKANGATQYVQDEQAQAMPKPRTKATKFVSIEDML